MDGNVSVAVVHNFVLIVLSRNGSFDRDKERLSITFSHAT